MKTAEGKTEYTERNGVLYPTFMLPTQPKGNIGKYGQMRLDFIKEHRRGTYTTLLTQAKLAEHLIAIDRETRTEVTRIIKQLSKTNGTDERLKVVDPMRWTELMNNYRNSAEEIVLREIIYR